MWSSDADKVNINLDVLSPASKYQKQQQPSMNQLQQSKSKSVITLDKIIQSTLVISNSKGLYKTLRDIRSSTYQIYGTEEKTINRTTTFNRMNT